VSEVRNSLALSCPVTNDVANLTIYVALLSSDNF